MTTTKAGRRRRTAVDVIADDPAQQPTWPLDRCRPHPDNVRYATVADPGLVASVAASGILQAIVLGPVEDDGTRFIIMGNRRYAAAVEVGLDVVPAVFRDDLDTAPNQLLAMLQENIHRDDLTPVEEGDAYQQLALYDLTDKDIAAATGRPVSTVGARRRLATQLGDHAREALHAGQMTLTEAHELAGFYTYPALYDTLEEAAGTNDWGWRLQHAKSERARIDANRATIADYEADGIPAANPDDGARAPLAAFPDDTTHNGCLRYVAFAEESYHAPHLVCVRPDTHPQPAASADTDGGARPVTVAHATYGDGPADVAAADVEPSEWAAGWEARMAAEAEATAAALARVQWATDHLYGTLPRTGTGRAALAAAARAILPPLIAADTRGVDLIFLAAATGADTVTWANADLLRARVVDDLTTGDDATTLRTLAAHLAAAMGTALNRAAYDVDDLPHQRRKVALWEWLDAAGHPDTAPDTLARDNDRQHLHDLTTAAETESGESE